MRFFERTTAAAGIAALAFLAIETRAAATPNFPARVAAELALDGDGPPQCSLCHEGPTQKGTVVTPFGTSMRGRGLVAYDEQALVNALMALEGEGTDSDGDGVGDIEELQQGADPNLAEGGDAPIVPEYGCSAGPRRGAATSALSVSMASLLAALIALARRRAIKGLSR